MSANDHLINIMVGRMDRSDDRADERHTEVMSGISTTNNKLTEVATDVKHLQAWKEKHEKKHETQSMPSVPDSFDWSMLLPIGRVVGIAIIGLGFIVAAVKGWKL